MLKNVKCARCVKCGKEYEAVPNLTNCECGGILDIIYDYDYIKKNLTKEKLRSRPHTMWRYRELLPVEETTPDTPLRVGWSPLYEEPRLASQLGLKKLWVKDKHIPWIHNVKNTDMAIAIDDEDSQRLLRLFNTAEGKKYLKEELKLSDELIEKLTWLGISGIANVLCCIKMAKYYELTEDDVVCTVLTDSAVMYGSRIEELNEMHGAYNAEEARLDHNLHMLGLKTDSMMELTYEDRKRIHNLKYYTWVEQQARDVKDLNALWYDTKGTWDAVHAQAKELDELINEFNEETGLLKAL